MDIGSFVMYYPINKLLNQADKLKLNCIDLLFGRLYKRSPDYTYRFNG